MRAFVMGHMSRPSTFQDAYRFKVATLDIGQVFYGVVPLRQPQKELVIGMRHNRIIDTPCTVSAIGKL